VSSLHFFLLPGELFSLLAEVAAKRPLVPLLERYPGEGRVRQWHVAEVGEELERLYAAAASGALYLSLGATPRHPEDLRFTDDAESQLLELTGGRQRGERLEQGTLRVFAKKSAARPLFTAIRRKIGAVAGRGGCFARLADGREVPYPDVYCSPAARQLTLCLASNAPGSVLFGWRDPDSA